MSGAMSATGRRGMEAAAGVLALTLGLAIAWVDSRPRWDDTGITAGALFLSAAAVTLASPRRPWLLGLLAGFGIWCEFVRNAVAAGHVSLLSLAIVPLIPLVFPMAGAYGGYLVRRAARSQRVV
ncbi:MAG TPA: hypothetical protein VME68_17330 [Acidobacteriaceae bacterium]|nr:hypothetical protein [Acidobacteriaceae bacterium]